MREDVSWLGTVLQPQKLLETNSSGPPRNRQSPSNSVPYRRRQRHRQNLEQIMPLRIAGARIRQAIKHR